MKKPNKDKRVTYDFVRDVKHKRESFAKDDVIDRPVNQVRRYEIKAAGISYQEGRNGASHTDEEIVEFMNKSLVKEESVPEK